MRRPAWIEQPGVRSLGAWVAAVLAVAVAYYVLAALGTVLSIPPSGFAIIWPATAFLVGVLLLTPAKRWWLYLFGLIPAHLLLTAQLQPDASPAVVVSQLMGNLALATATALAARRGGDNKLDLSSFKGLSRYVAVAGLAMPAVINALILMVHLATGRTLTFWESWREWMLASIFPAVTLTPLMVLLVRGGALRSERERTELTLVAVGLFAVSYFAFGPGGEAYSTSLLLVPIPFFLWAAVRSGIPGAAVTLLVFATAIIARALQGGGPFGQGASPGGLIALQVFLTGISAPTMLLAALIADRKRDEAELRRSQAQVALAAAATDTGLWQWDEAGGQLWMTDHCREMFGLGARPEGGPQIFLRAVHPDDQARVATALDETSSLIDRTVSDFRVVRGGDERRYTMRAHADFDGVKRTVRLSGVFRDNTEWFSAQDQAEQMTRRLLTLQEDERKAIAEALHDTTIQHLVAVELTLSRLERRRPMAAEAKVFLDDIRNANAEAIKELRAFTYLLRPPDLGNEDLALVLHRYVRGFGLRTGLKTHLRISPQLTHLPVEQQRVLMRVTQESLTNVYRHAGATKVWLDIRSVSGELHLLVRDDGCGLPEPEAGDQPVRLGVGIPGMAAHIRQMGGKIDIRSGSRGATVHVAIPAPSAPDAHCA